MRRKPREHADVAKSRGFVFAACRGGSEKQIDIRNDGKIHRKYRSVQMWATESHDIRRDCLFLVAFGNLFDEVDAVCHPSPRLVA